MRAGAQASTARAQANLTKAIEQLGYAQVKADFAGVVTAVSAEVGQVVSPGQNVVTVARPDIREAVVDIGEDFPVPLEIDLPFTIGLQLLPAVQVEGKVGANFVWVVDQPANTVSLHKVDLAGDPAGARVAGGLAPGARVVTAGIHSLKQGQQVRIEQDQKP